jgi:integrase
VPPGISARRGDKARRTETIKFLTLDETKRLFSRITDKRDKAIFLTAYRHGLRASEVGLLRVEDLDLKRLKIMLHRMKGSLSGEHPLQPDEARALKAWLKARGMDSPVLFTSARGLPISRQMLDVLMKRYGGEAKLPREKRHFHVLARLPQPREEGAPILHEVAAAVKSQPVSALFRSAG